MRRTRIVVMALVLVAAQACSWVIADTSGNRVRVILATNVWPTPANSGVIQRADGSEVLIERAYVAWSGVHLTACGQHDLPRQSALHFLNIARATHGPDTVLAVRRPTLESLLPHATMQLAELSPPSARYCKLTLSVAASDSHTSGPADLDMRGVSLIVEGWQRPTATAAWQSFALRESAAFDVVVTLDQDIADGTALEAVVTRAAGWLDGIDLSATGAARRVLEQLQRATEVTLQ